MELHHSRHHRAYVDNLNAATQQLAGRLDAKDVAGQVALQEAIMFHGRGHLTHSIFWKNLAPQSSSEAVPDAAPHLVEKISEAWGGLDQFKKAFAAALLGIKGSGWGWLGRDEVTGLRITTTKYQDPPVNGEVPIFGVDMWEHAYYLQVCKILPSTNSKLGADKCTRTSYST